MSNRSKISEGFDAPFEVAENPEKPVVAERILAPGVKKVVRGERKSNVVASAPTIEQAREALAQIGEIGRQQGGTSQGSPGAGSRAGGYNYNK